MGEFYVESNYKEVERALAKLKQHLREPALSGAAKEIERETLRRFRQTTATWSHKPKFESIVETDKDGFEILVGTDDEIYRYVDQGTRPHEITPRRPGGVLVFQEGYRAKTQPNVLKSVTGGPFGAVIKTRRVWHPGTKAREFVDMIRNIMRVQAVNIATKHIQRWARKKYA